MEHNIKSKHFLTFVFTVNTDFLNYFYRISVKTFKIFTWLTSKIWSTYNFRLKSYEFLSAFLFLCNVNWYINKKKKNFATQNFFQFIRHQKLYIQLYYLKTKTFWKHWYLFLMKIWGVKIKLIFIVIIQL